MNSKKRTGLLAIVCLVFVPGAFGQLVEGKTFTVQEGAFPWYDRADWTLTNIPASLKDSGPLPQQNCSSRSLDIPSAPAAPAAITLGVCDRDLAEFAKRQPAAKKTADVIAVKNPAGVVLNYIVFTLENPPAHIDGAGFNAGMMLLKITTK
ncbi:MAG: hypothetical protein LBK99_06935 [Opitutaceae bacterium]|jgi:hypothetical protein|nr:hypothetical protein [Opitutaceae bacterium]